MNIWIALGIMAAGVAANACSRFLRLPLVRFAFSLPGVIACLMMVVWMFDRYGWWQALLAFMGMGWLYSMLLVAGMKLWGLPISAIQEAETRAAGTREAMRQMRMFDDEP